jgi:hypothetical protein
MLLMREFAFLYLVVLVTLLFAAACGARKRDTSKYFVTLHIAESTTK